MLEVKNIYNKCNMEFQDIIWIEETKEEEYELAIRIKNGDKEAKNKLIESNILDKDAVFTIDNLKEMLVQRFNQIDFKQVRDYAQRFVMKNEDLSLYCKELFIDCVNKM